MDERRRRGRELCKQVLAERVRMVRRDLARVVENVEGMCGVGGPVLAKQCEALERELDGVLARLRLI